MGTAILTMTTLIAVFAALVIREWLACSGRNKSFTSFAYEQRGYLLTPASLANPMPELRLQFGTHAVNVHEVLRGGNDVRRSIAFILELEGGSKAIGALDIRTRGCAELYEEAGRATRYPSTKKNLAVEDGEFDEVFIVHSNNQDVALSLLSEDVRAALLSLNETDPKGGLVVNLSRHSLSVLKGNLPRSVASIRSFFRLASVLFRLVLKGIGYSLPCTSAIEATEAVGEGQCPVCAGTLDENVVRCAWCKTPHHEECWYYNQERCAIFGCKGRRHLLGDG